MQVFKEMLKRAARSAVAIGAAIGVQALTNSTDPTILAIAPILMAIGKGLRTKFAGAWWLPV